MKKIFIIFISVLFFTITANAQFSNIVNKSQVHGSFEADGMYYHPDEAMGITDSLINGKNFGFNAFARITYSLGNFSAGFRYEAFLPEMAGFDPRLNGNGFPNIWASYTMEKFSFTVGSFYEQFGNGLTLRSYEEWTLGYDNAINGIKIQYEPLRGLIFKGVYGVQRFFWTKFEKNNRSIVKGADLELCFNDVFTSMQNSKLRLTIGGSAVSKYQSADMNPTYKLPNNVGNFAGRFNLGVGKFNFSSEYAYKINDPSAINNYIYKPGESFLFTASYSRKGLGVFAMFKRTDNFSYKSDLNEKENALDINFLPPIIEPHTYMLASMYPYSTQPNGEIGFQFQIDYKIPKKSKLGGRYGWGIHINYSQINDIVRDSINDTTSISQDGTLGYTSNFFRFSDQVFNRDLTIEIDKKFSKKFKGVLKYIYQEYDIATLQGHDGHPIIHADIVIVDMTYKFTSKKALRWEVQGLFTNEDKGSWAAALVEYTISPHWFFTVSDQWNYGNEVKSEQLHYYTGAFGYTLKTTRFAITYGRQREGVVCVGGVCRQVPASSGFYVTISSNF